MGASKCRSVGALDRGSGSFGVLVLKRRTVAVGVLERWCDCRKVTHRFRVDVGRSVSLSERRSVGVWERWSVRASVSWSVSM